MNREEAMARIEAIEREAAELRKIVEAEPKKEPRGLCWVWDNGGGPWSVKRIRPIIGYALNRYVDDSGNKWDYANPLTAAEMEQYRGRWE